MRLQLTRHWIKHLVRNTFPTRQCIVTDASRCDGRLLTWICSRRCTPLGLLPVLRRPLNPVAAAWFSLLHSGDAVTDRLQRSGDPNRVMSSSVSPYAALPPIRSSLFNSPPETVPPTDELELLHAELMAFKSKSLERAKKAGDDIRTIEESMRRLKEKEKGKAKAIQKAERDRACALYLIA